MDEWMPRGSPEVQLEWLRREVERMAAEAQRDAADPRARLLGDEGFYRLSVGLRHLLDQYDAERVSDDELPPWPSDE